MKIFSFLFCCLFTYSSFSQTQMLQAKDYPPSMYFDHTVTGSETLLSLAIRYRLSPNTLAAFNKMSLGTNLTAGQLLKVPITKTNLSDPHARVIPSEVLVPLTITFSDNSSIKKIVSTYNVADTLLIRWNPGIKEKIVAGTTVFIGYIRTTDRTRKSVVSTIDPTSIATSQRLPNTQFKMVQTNTNPNETKTVTPAVVETQKNHHRASKQKALKPIPGSQIRDLDMMPPGSQSTNSNEAKSKTIAPGNTATPAVVSVPIPDSLAALSSDALFQLARSAAFDKKNYQLALQYCQIALVKSPTYNDIRVFEGRIYNWSGKPDSARISFEKALAQEPDNLEAFQAYVDLENWNDRPEHALILADSGLLYHPHSSQLLMKKAKLLVVLNRPMPASAVLETLLKKDPTNTVARALSARLRNDRSGNALGFTYDYFYFDKQFNDPWHLVSLDYRRQTKIGGMGAHINYANRFTRNGVQYEVDGYPRLMKNVNGYFNFAYSTDEGVFAKYRAGSSMYFTLPKSYEAEVGFRYLYFSNATWIYTFAAAKYYKNWYILARTYLTPGNQNISHSYNITGRYYFGGADDFFALTLGTGVSPDENTSNVLLNSNYKLITRKISANYRQFIKDKYIITVSAGWVNQEFKPKVKGNQLDAGIGWQVRF